MNYTIPPISNQQLSKEKPCVVKAKINGGALKVLTQNWQLFQKILVDGEQIPFPEDNTKLIYTLPEGSHDIHYYLKPWEVHNHNYPEYKGQYILYSGQFAQVGLTNITIPDNIVAIGTQTFDGNTNWQQETLEIPENVKEIGFGAFSGFHGNVIIHTSDNLKISSGFSTTVNNLTFLGTGDIEVTSANRCVINGNLTFDRQNVTFNGAFSQVNGEEINFGQGNIIFETQTGGAFSGSNSLKRIIFGDGNITMRNTGGRFCSNSALETITFGNGDIEIDGGNFSSNPALKKIDFGKKGNLTINGGNFIGLTSLEEVRFPDGLTTFTGSGNFTSSPLLKSVKIPNLKTAANGAVIPFTVPTDLEIGSVDIPDSTNSNYNSFYNVKNLIIHRGKIGNCAFANSSPLQSLTLGDVEIGNYAFIGTGTNDGYEAKLSNGITKIGISAFAGAKLTKINIPTTLKEIPQNCFESTWLTEVEIPASVAVIGPSAFNGAPIGKLTLNNGLRRIETQAFMNTKMFDLVIPETVEYIGQYAFCSNNNYPNYCLTNLTINMKQGKIDDHAFQYCMKLRNLTIYPGVEELGEYTFYNAMELVKIHIPGTVKKIGDNCFYGFGYNRGSDYKEITLEEGVKHLGYQAFSNGNINKDLILPNSIEYLGSSCLPNTSGTRIIIYNPNPPERGSSMNTINVPSHLVSKYSAAGYSVASL